MNDCQPLPEPPSLFRPFILPHAAAALLLVLAGCFPSSCRRTETRALFPSDSLSREMAEQTSVDTLRLAWEARTTEAVPLAYPRTVLFGEDGTVYVGDAERNSLFAFGTDGRYREEIAPEQLDVPYLAGHQGDTLVVFSAGAGRFDFVADGDIVQSADVGADPARQTLQYGAYWKGNLYYKAVGEDAEGYIARLDARGEVAERAVLPGPYWRHAGFLRAWGDSLLSLSGYRPVIDVATEEGDALRLDTLALTGFDSPMLARSRLFTLGEVYDPPLLTASAAAAGDRLFVLNMRPGWLRVDVYNRHGRLQNVLVQENPLIDKNFYPTDIAARRTSGGITRSPWWCRSRCRA
ncbi:MAG: hypothetical protein ACR2GR_04255 [Rhodothermales bacterium]